MRLLPDTHALLWFCEGNPALSATARAAMEDATNERYVSHATPWEVAIKCSLGKLELAVSRLRRAGPVAEIFSSLRS
jgi:PIN domain nuclease of toxin-antitoxin system